MAVLEGLLLFLVVPTGAAVMAILAGWHVYSDLRSRRSIPDRIDMGPREARPAGLFVNYPAVMSTPIVYGLVLWSFGSL